MNAFTKFTATAIPADRVVLDTSHMADALALGLDTTADRDDADWRKITRTLHPRVGPILTFNSPDGEVEFVGATALRTLIAEAQDALRLGGEVA